MATSRYGSTATGATGSTSVGSSTNTSNQSSNSSSFTGISDPEALKLLSSFIQQLSTGGTTEDKATRAARNQTIADTRNLQADYTKEAAFSDAQNLMAQNLQASLEKNMPTIARSIEGAGTSASSMQALLAQKLATDSAQAAGALGAQQAVSYGNLSANLSSVLEALTKSDSSNATALINALGLLKNSTSASASQGTSSGTSNQSAVSGNGGATNSSSSSTQLTGADYWAAEDAKTAAQNNSGLITYEVPSGSNVWANYTGVGTQGTSTSLPDGYMDIQNTTDYSTYW